MGRADPLVILDRPALAPVALARPNLPAVSPLAPVHVPLPAPPPAAGNRGLKKRILFVDDQLSVLQALQQALHGQREEWDMRFVTSAETALCLLQDAPADVVVTDIQMPDMDGLELLRRVAKTHPGTIRMVLAGDASPDLLVQCASIAHQFRGNAGDGASLRQALDRVFALETLVGDSRMRGFISGLTTLPTMPSVYHELRRQLDSADVSLELIGETLQRDPAVTYRLLQLVNSAAFGIGRPITHPAQAAMILGVETIKTVLLWVHVFQDGPQRQVPGYVLEEIARGSQRTARLAQELVRAENGPRTLKDTAFAAGLLHDIGRLVFALGDPQLCAQAHQLSRREQLPLWQAERALCGFTHAETGAYLLGLWGLPLDLVEAVAYHHAPAPCKAKGFGVVAALHAAVGLGETADTGREPALDQEFLRSAGLVGQVTGWQRVAAQTAGNVPGR